MTDIHIYDQSFGIMALPNGLRPVELQIRVLCGRTLPYGEEAKDILAETTCMDCARVYCRANEYWRLEE